VDPHGFISRYQAARPANPGTAPWVADAIFRARFRQAAMKDAIAAPVVCRYAASTSFEGARSNFALLREVAEGSWTREHDTRDRRSESVRRGLEELARGELEPA
jgi:hypothetical protein